MRARMGPRQLLSRAWRAFAAAERGTVTIEAVLILPLVIWAYMGSLAFFKAFHAESLLTKSAYTIGDALSREQKVSPAYVTSMYALQGLLIEGGAPRRLRITAMRYSRTGAHVVCWSQARGGPAAMTTARLRAMSARLPLMPEGAVAILAEAWTDHVPFRSGIVDPVTFYELAVTRPRSSVNFTWSTTDSDTSPTVACP